jgi:hypothetical protein
MENGRDDEKLDWKQQLQAHRSQAKRCGGAHIKHLISAFTFSRRYKIESNRAIALILRIIGHADSAAITVETENSTA